MRRRLVEFSDEQLITELKRRGIKIEIDCTSVSGGCWHNNPKIKIGGVVFDT